MSNEEVQQGSTVDYFFTLIKDDVRKGAADVFCIVRNVFVSQYKSCTSNLHASCVRLAV